MHMPYSLNKSHSSAIRPALNSLDAAPAKSKGTMHISTILTIYAAIEFLAVACSAYFASLIYHFAVLRAWPDVTHYTVAATAVAMLVLGISLASRNFVAVRRQTRHVFVWRGLGAVALSFPIFLTILYFTHFVELYSRGTFLFQVACVSITVISMRALFYSWLQHALVSNQIEARRVVLIGDISHCSTFTNRLKISGIQTVAMFHLPKHCRMKEPIIHEMIAECRLLRVDDVIILANNKFMPTMFDLASALAELPAGVHVIPVDALNVFASSQITELGTLQTI